MCTTESQLESWMLGHVNFIEQSVRGFSTYEPYAYGYHFILQFTFLNCFTGKSRVSTTLPMTHIITVLCFYWVLLQLIETYWSENSIASEMQSVPKGWDCSTGFKTTTEAAHFNYQKWFQNLHSSIIKIRYSLFLSQLAF